MYFKFLNYKKVKLHKCFFHELTYKLKITLNHSEFKLTYSGHTVI